MDFEVKITCTLNSAYQVMDISICGHYLNYLTKELILFLDIKHKVDGKSFIKDPFAKIEFVYDEKYNNDDFGIKSHLNKLSSKFIEELKNKLIQRIIEKNNNINKHILFLSMVEYYRKENLNLIEINPELLKLLSFPRSFDLIKSLKKSQNYNMENMSFYQSLDPNDTYSYKISFENKTILEENKYNTLNYINIFLISFIFGIFINILISIIKNLIKLNK